MKVRLGNHKGLPLHQLWICQFVVGVKISCFILRCNDERLALGSPLVRQIIFLGKTLRAVLLL